MSRQSVECDNAYVSWKLKPCFVATTVHTGCCCLKPCEGVSCLLPAKLNFKEICPILKSNLHVLKKGEHPNRIHYNVASVPYLFQ